MIGFAISGNYTLVFIAKIMFAFMMTVFLSLGTFAVIQ